MYAQLPNQLTMLRLALSACFFVLLNQYRYPVAGGDPHSGLLWTSIILFLLAVFTDWLDGYLARRWNVESRFGRIMDPVVDKVLIMGSFIYLAGPRFVIPEQAAEGGFYNMASGVYPWMSVVIIARELLVTAIRSEIETSGGAFGANLWGKLKMIIQSIMVPMVLLLIWLDPRHNPWAGHLRDVLVYFTVIVTIASGVPYITGARRSMKRAK